MRTDEALKVPQDLERCIALPVPARDLRLALKDTGTDPGFVTFTV